MRLLFLAVALSGLCGLFTWNRVVRDREFDEYAGVEIGMPLSRARDTLEDTGWLRMRPPAARVQDQSKNCGAANAQTFVKGKRPEYALVLTTNDDCTVTQIVPRTRQFAF
ncbi:MAG: hypothetical protein ACMUJI_08220 [Erythrobacter sp.]|uniref:hypothetical protein n=1 Tax=Erythrobacter sp. TaxID=1042 RepID=UPI003A86F9E8